MSMTAGTITITANADGTASYSGSGMALALGQTRFGAQVPGWQALAATFGGSLPPAYLSCVQTAANTLATQVTSEATALVGYLQANAVAKVTNQSLGRTPSDNTPNTPIQPPSAEVDVPIA